MTHYCLEVKVIKVKSQDQVEGSNRQVTTSVKYNQKQFSKKILAQMLPKKTRILLKTWKFRLTSATQFKVKKKVSKNR